MTRPSLTVQLGIASLIGLLTIHCVMLGALFAQVPPNPPGRFGPYIGAIVALAAAALPLYWWRSRVGKVAALLVALMCLLSVGPQKILVEPAALQLLPVILLGSTLSLTLIAATVMGWKESAERG